MDIWRSGWGKAEVYSQPMLCSSLKQASDLAIFVNGNAVGRRYSGQAGHGHNVATDHHNKSGTSTEPHFADGYHMVDGRTFKIGVGGKLYCVLAIQTGKLP